MILHPSVIALIAGSAMISSMLVYSSWHGVRIMRKWDLRSGSELQLDLEKRTYLISTIMAYAFGFQLISLFLFIYTADSLCTMFVGAMCAAGTLNVNAYGYPVFVLKVVNFLVAGLWLVMNHADNSAFDYPLIRTKYAFLLVIAPFILAEAVLQYLYFQGLEADLITSCCGSLFSSEGKDITSQVFSLPPSPMKISFYSGMAVAMSMGVYFFLRGKGSFLFALSSLAAFIISSLSLVTFISLYIYELPTHFCPFCVLKKEYGYIGYVLYVTLFGGAVTGTGTGMLGFFRNIPSLSEVVPVIQRRLATATVILYMVFTAISTYKIVFTSFRLED
jgi:hypothetical protein